MTWYSKKHHNNNNNNNKWQSNSNKSWQSNNSKKVGTCFNLKNHGKCDKPGCPYIHEAPTDSQTQMWDFAQLKDNKEQYEELKIRITKDAFNHIGDHVDDYKMVLCKTEVFKVINEICQMAASNPDEALTTLKNTKEYMELQGFKKRDVFSSKQEEEDESKAILLKLSEAVAMMAIQGQTVHDSSKEQFEILKDMRDLMAREDDEFDELEDDGSNSRQPPMLPASASADVSMIQSKLNVAASTPLPAGGKRKVNPFLGGHQVRKVKTN